MKQTYQRSLQWLSIWGSQPLWESSDSFTRVTYQIFILWFIAEAKLHLWPGNENNFMVGEGHHNMRNCIKGSQHQESGERLTWGILLGFLQCLLVKTCTHYILELLGFKTIMSPQVILTWNYKSHFTHHLIKNKVKEKVFIAMVSTERKHL